MLGCDELSCLNIGMNLCDEFNGQNDNVNFLMVCNGHVEFSAHFFICK